MKSFLGSLPLMKYYIFLILMLMACGQRHHEPPKITPPVHQQDSILIRTINAQDSSKNISHDTYDTIVVDTSTSYIVAYAISQPEYDTMSLREKDEYDEGYGDLVSAMLDFKDQKPAGIKFETTASRFIVFKDSVIDRKKLKKNNFGVIFITKNGKIKIIEDGMATSDIKKEVGELFDQVGDSLNACWLVTHPVDGAFIQKNAKRIITEAQDNCVLVFLDKMVDSSFRKDGQKYLLILMSIAKVSDGYVAEEFDAIAARLFNKNFDRLFPLIYKDKSTFDDPFVKFIIEGMGISIADSGDKIVEKKRIGDFLDKEERSLRMTDSQKEYTENLRLRIFAYRDK